MPTLLPTPAVPITCTFTVDDRVLEVFVNGEDVTPTGTCLTSWQTACSVTFDSVHNRSNVLAIKGYDGSFSSGCCEYAGLAVTCSSSGSASWDALSSNTANWVAYGATTDSDPSETWYAGDDLSAFSTPCVGTSTFYCSSCESSYTKIWAANGLQYAWFVVVLDP